MNFDFLNIHRSPRPRVRLSSSSSSSEASDEEAPAPAHAHAPSPAPAPAAACDTDEEADPAPAPVPHLSSPNAKCYFSLGTFDGDAAPCSHSTRAACQLQRRQQHMLHSCPDLRLIATVQIFHVNNALYPSPPRTARPSSAASQRRRRRSWRLVDGEAGGSQLLCEHGQKRGVEQQRPARRPGVRRAGRRQMQ